MNAPAFVPLPREEQHRLITSNQGLVRHIAMQIPGPLPFDDKVAAGNLGMVMAAQHYDPFRAVKFSTYASFWIRAYINRASITDAGMPDTRHGRRMYFGLRRAIRNCEQAGVESTNERLCAMLDVPMEVMEGLRERVLAADSHIEAMTYKDSAGDDTALNEGRMARIGLVSEDDPERDVMAVHDSAESLDRMAEYLNALKPRERDVIVRRYFNEEADTLVDIGKDWGVSRERVRQVEVIALRKMKGMMEKRGMP